MKPKQQSEFIPDWAFDYYWSNNCKKGINCILDTDVYLDMGDGTRDCIRSQIVAAHLFPKDVPKDWEENL